MPVAARRHLDYRAIIHKDPVKIRVALLAADPPDNTATQPVSSFEDRVLLGPLHQLW